MSVRTKPSKLDVRTRAFIAHRKPVAPRYWSYVEGLWDRYLALGLANTDFVDNFTSGTPSSQFQTVWEMMLAAHLDALGFKLLRATYGPDLCLELAGKKVWIEAICPDPKGLLGNWLAFPRPGEFNVGTVPNDRILLRWTAAFREKARKLKEYREKGLVGAADAYVIAINGSQLSLVPFQHGISQLPLAVEAVFPIGPIQLLLHRDTHQIEGGERSLRFSVKKASGEPR